MKKTPRSADETSLAQTILFPINREDYEFVLSNKSSFCGPIEGGGQKIQLGPPWWWNDSIEGIRAVIRMWISTGELSSSVGMLSDARSLPPVIARNKLFRAILAVEMASADTLSHLTTEQLVDIARPVCFENGRKWLGVKLDEAVAV